MFPFTRANETTKPRGNYSVGILVKLADGRKFFFPGGEPEDGMMLARMALTEAELTAPNTLVEWGERIDNEWIPAKTVKASAAIPIES